MVRAGVNFKGSGIYHFNLELKDFESKGIGTELELIDFEPKAQLELNETNCLLVVVMYVQDSAHIACVQCFIVPCARPELKILDRPHFHVTLYC